jgi:hypothetical protein
MKLHLINSTTATDNKGTTWFLEKEIGAHSTWTRCSNCNQCIQVHWEPYPNFDGEFLCKDCVEEE